MTCIAAKIGSDPEKDPEEQVVLFTGTSFLPHGSKPSSAKPRLTSERSLRLDIATLEAAIQVPYKVKQMSFWSNVQLIPN